MQIPIQENTPKATLYDFIKPVASGSVVGGFGGYVLGTYFFPILGPGSLATAIYTTTGATAGATIGSAYDFYLIMGESAVIDAFNQEKKRLLEQIAELLAKNNALQKQVDEQYTKFTDTHVESINKQKILNQIISDREEKIKNLSEELIENKKIQAELNDELGLQNTELDKFLVLNMRLKNIIKELNSQVDILRKDQAFIRKIQDDLQFISASQRIVEKLKDAIKEKFGEATTLAMIATFPATLKNFYSKKQREKQNYIRDIFDKAVRSEFKNHEDFDHRQWVTTFEKIINDLENKQDMYQNFIALEDDRLKTITVDDAKALLHEVEEVAQKFEQLHIFQDLEKASEKEVSQGDPLSKESEMTQAAKSSFSAWDWSSRITFWKAVPEIESQVSNSKALNVLPVATQSL